MKEYFPEIPTIKFDSKAKHNDLSFNFYNADEVILGKKMKEHFRFSMAWWHALCGTGADMFGPGVMDKTFGGSDWLSVAKAKADAGFEIMTKLGIEFFCFHDADIVDEAETLAETNKRLDIVTDYIKELMEKTGIKCLWGTANLFSHPRFMSGAGTSPSADIFAYSAAKIEKAIELTVKLGGSGYVFWGGREGYETLLNTDMKLELDNMAILLRMCIDYARSIGYTGDFYIEPKPKEPMKHQYDFDAATTCNFLRTYDLLNDIKLNIEANHATLAGHTFAHELRTAAVNGVFGSIDANQGDLLLGWDTDQFPADVYDATACMLEVLHAGGFTNGGINFDAKARRSSHTMEDLIHGFITAMDTYALGLRKAAKIVEDGRVDSLRDDRYASWGFGLGADIKNGKLTIQDLEAYAMKAEPPLPHSASQERLEGIVNRIMFS